LTLFPVVLPGHLTEAFREMVDSGDWASDQYGQDRYIQVPPANEPELTEDILRRFTDETFPERQP
jgi:hypothetical protein